MCETRSCWTRRSALQLGAALAVAPALSFSKDKKMLTRPIPASGEELPVIGLGTYNVFDVASTPANINARRMIVESLVEKGASLIDSSPMYNRCLLYTSPSPRDGLIVRMPASA